MDFSIVCVYNNREILSQYLLESLKKQTISYELILLDGSCSKYKSAADALNAGGEQAKGRYILFVHQDIKFKNSHFLEETLKYLDEHNNLGIAGIAGKSPEIKDIISNSSNGVPPLKLSANCINDPVIVQTLDECVLIVPRVRFETTRFDSSTCNHWHLYGVDYSLMMRSSGFEVMVLPTQVYHLSEGASMNSAYFSSLERLIEKHRFETTIIATTVGNWSTSLPVAYQKFNFYRSFYWYSFYKLWIKYFNTGILNYNLWRHLENKNGIFLSAVEKNEDSKEITIGKGQFRVNENWDEIACCPRFHVDRTLTAVQVKKYFDTIKENKISANERFEFIVVFDMVDSSNKFLSCYFELLKDMGILFLQIRGGENLAWQECPDTGQNNSGRFSTENWIKILQDAEIEILCITTHYPYYAILICRKNRNHKTTNSGFLRKYALWRLISNFEADKLWKKKKLTT